MKQQLIGTISFKRIYNDKGVLKSETRTTNLSGKMDAMGQQLPVKMTGNLETIVEQAVTITKCLGLKKASIQKMPFLILNAE